MINMGLIKDRKTKKYLVISAVIITIAFGLHYLMGNSLFFIGEISATTSPTVYINPYLYPSLQQASGSVVSNFYEEFSPAQATMYANCSAVSGATPSSYTPYDLSLPNRSISNYSIPKTSAYCRITLPSPSSGVLLITVIGKNYTSTQYDIKLTVASAYPSAMFSIPILHDANGTVQCSPFPSACANTTTTITTTSITTTTSTTTSSVTTSSTTTIPPQSWWNGEFDAIAMIIGLITVITVMLVILLKRR